MFKHLSAVRKEFLILLRDKAGLAMLFIMPMVLIVISSLMQESGWGNLSKDPKVDVIYVDNDQDSLAAKIKKGFIASGSFNVSTEKDGVLYNEFTAREAVAKGEFQIAIVIPEGSTKRIRSNVRVMVAKTLAGFGMMNPLILNSLPSQDSVVIGLYFDPTVKSSFKSAIISSIKANNYRVETEMVFKTFNQEIAKQMPMYKPPKVDYNEVLKFSTSFPSYREKEVIPNTTQHNVPAWTIFAIFFIVIPFTQSLIKEREEGSFFRLLTMPVSYMNLLLAKVNVYILVCIIQTFCMFITGALLLPLFGLPVLDFGHQIFAILIMSLVIAAAAVGFGLMVGTIARTHQQAAAFGSLTVIILAAMGGLWVPIYLMPGFMRTVSQLSPMNWAITGYYNIFLRGGDLINIYPEIIKLLLFFLFTILLTAIYRRIKNPLNV
ncbi:MAG: ABC transporter permease [Syntrophothermus sp.]